MEVAAGQLKMLVSDSTTLQSSHGLGGEYAATDPTAGDRPLKDDGSTPGEFAAGQLKILVSNNTTLQSSHGLGGEDAATDPTAGDRPCAGRKSLLEEITTPDCNLATNDSVASRTSPEHRSSNLPQLPPSVTANVDIALMCNSINSIQPAVPRDSIGHGQDTMQTDKQIGSALATTTLSEAAPVTAHNQVHQEGLGGKQQADTFLSPLGVPAVSTPCSTSSLPTPELKAEASMRVRPDVHPNAERDKTCDTQVHETEIIARDTVPVSAQPLTSPKIQTSPFKHGQSMHQVFTLTSAVVSLVISLVILFTTGSSQALRPLFVSY